MVKTNTKMDQKWLRSSDRLDRPQWTSKGHGRGRESQNRYVSCTVPKLQQPLLHQDGYHCRSFLKGKRKWIKSCKKKLNFVKLHNSYDSPYLYKVSFWFGWDLRANRRGEMLKALVNRVVGSQKIVAQNDPQPFWNFEVQRKSIDRTTYFLLDHRKPELETKNNY